MAQQSREDRTSNHPVSKRLKFYIGIAVFLITVSGYTLRNVWEKSPEAVPSPTTTIPAPTSPDGEWGPSRKTFTISQPATYAVLNSITDNPNYGDERGFFAVRHQDSDREGSDFKTALKVSPGDVITLRGYYENSAADNFQTDPAWIQGATAVLAYDNSPLLRRVMQLSISADNSPTIWASLVVHSETLVSLEHVSGSARIYNNAHSVKSGGYAFNIDELRTASGLKLGYEVMDGTVQPGYQYAGYIYFNMKVVDAS